MRGKFKTGKSNKHKKVPLSILLLLLGLKCERRNVKITMTFCCSIAEEIGEKVGALLKVSCG